MSVLHFGQVYIACERARLGDSDGALPLLRSAADHMPNVGQLGALVPATGTLVEDQGFLPRDVWLLRPRALLVRARGDETRSRNYRDRYRGLATSLGFEEHMKWAEDAMTGAGLALKPSARRRPQTASLPGGLQCGASRPAVAEKRVAKFGEHSFALRDLGFDRTSPPEPQLARSAALVTCAAVIPALR